MTRELWSRSILLFVGIAFCPFPLWVGQTAESPVGIAPVLLALCGMFIVLVGGGFCLLRALFVLLFPEEDDKVSANELAFCALIGFWVACFFFALHWRPLSEGPAGPFRIPTLLLVLAFLPTMLALKDLVFDILEARRPKTAPLPFAKRA